MSKGNSQKSEFKLSPDHEFIVPTKGIKNPNDMIVWQKSEAYFEYLGFILAINESIQGKNINAQTETSTIVEKMMKMLNKFDDLITQIPPVDQPQRFGNQAFRTWHNKIQESSIDDLKEVLPEDIHKAIPEIVEYLLEGFGNPTRIDYGTGHEMTFIMFLCCMFKIGAFTEQDKVPVALKIFNRYLEIVRRLQLVYKMEPAGSHGVWSLDDFQFVPFIWGSAQLNGHPRIEPQHFVDHGVVENYGKQYMFLGCIDYICKVKTGPFAEHSNQLWNVSAVSSWSKVNSGLIRMYKAEVLAKFPVIQHVLFGSLFSIKQAPENAMCNSSLLGPTASLLRT